MPTDEQSCWDARYTGRPESWTEPDEFLQQAWTQYLSDAPSGAALDLAGGAGRNAAFLLARGWCVRLLDISAVGVQLAREKAVALEPPAQARLQSEVLDLNTISDLGSGAFDLVIVFYFLRRELFPAIFKALKPGGLLIYKTHTIEQMNLQGGPHHPDHLLQHGELRQAFAQMQILHFEERTAERALAELIARK